MHASLLTPSKYIKAPDFQGIARTFTITGIKIEELIREDNTKERKGTVSFAETDKSWVLNVTNVRCLVAVFGTETNDWLGKKVTLYPEPNEMSSSGFAIRVKGSPELAEDVTFTLKLARKKPRRVTLKAFGKNGTLRPKPQPAVSAAEDGAAAGELPEPPLGAETDLDDFEKGFVPNQT